VITFLEPVDDLETQINRLLNSRSIQRVRRGKAYDLRPLILTLELIPKDEVDRQQVFTRLSAKEGAVPPQDIMVQRVALIFSGT
jgi:hypothetical protein